MASTDALMLREWAEPVRTVGAAVLARAADPHAELLALVWGPRFDRQHAHALFDGQAPAPPDSFKTVMEVADRFDGLASAQQQRLRQLILRHRSRATRW